MFGITTERAAARKVEAAVAETRSSIENPAVPLSDAAAWRSLLGDWHNVAGVVVTADTALEVPAIWAAINFISSTIASLPLQVFAKTDKGRDTANGDTLYPILHDAPNDELTSYQWRKGMMINILSRGRGLSFIERNLAGRVVNLWPLETDKTTIERRDGKKRYRYRDGNREVIYDAREIIDIPWMLKPDGLAHVDPITKLRGTVGLAIALQQYAEKLFLNGGIPPLALQGSVPSPGAASRAVGDLKKAVRDANSEQRDFIFVPAGHELKPIGVDPDKSQMEEARRFQVEEVARVFNIPPTFLQDLSHGTFSNTEQQDLAFVKHTVTQWVEAWEQELNLKLFAPRNRTKFVEFNVDGLLRGDFKTRMEGNARAIQTGQLTPDEARASENRPPMEHGDQLYIQGATVPLGTVLTQPAAPTTANDNVDPEPKPDE